jgi:hypothetical protein
MEKKKRKKRFKSYQEYQTDSASKDPSRVEHYPPPKYVIQPAPGDTGFALLKSAFDRTEKVLEPGLWVSK